jgi:putative uncharacterized protein cgl1852
MGDKKNDVKQMHVYVPMDLYKQIEYWAAKHDCTITQYMCDALEHMIRYENKDYDLPTMEQARLNQLIDAMHTLSSNVDNLSEIATKGFSALIGLTRGDNYLLEDDNE